MTKASIKAFFEQFAIIVVLAVPVGWLLCGNCWGNVQWMLNSAWISIGIWTVMWLGNGYIVDFISKRISWLEQPVKRFVIGVLAMVIYTVAAIVLIDYIIHLAFGVNDDWYTWENILQSGTIAVIITTIIALFLHARGFYISWKREVLNAEKYRAESINSKYETLKNQVNPHFLFNSLNVLTTLVYKDQDLAAKFIKKLSSVYRYVLDTKDEEVVDLDAELEFVKDFVFLQQIRFGDSLKLDNRIESKNMKVPPLALQLLIENAIKHNEISENQPLTIDLAESEGYLEVTNNLQPKTIMEEDKNNLGLSNLKLRYEYLTDRLVEVLDDSKTFKVRIPLIQS